MSNLSITRLEQIAYGSVRQSAEEGVWMARELLALWRAQREPIAFIAECGAIIGEGSPFFDDYKNPQPLYAAAQLPAVPDGWVIVPREMTDEIGEAIALEAKCCGGIALDIYNAAIAAAPKLEA